MQLDDYALSVVNDAIEQGYNNNEIIEALKQSGYDVPDNILSTSEPIKQKSPGVVKGMGETAANAFAMGQGSRLAGLANTGIGKIATRVFNPIQALVSGEMFRPLTQEELDPRNFKAQYEQGKQAAEQELETFKEEHPAAATIADVGGTIGSIAVGGGLARGGVSAAMGVNRMARATKALGKAGTLAARALGEGVTFGTYEGVRSGFGDGRSDVREAGKGFIRGGALGVGLGVVGGAMGAVEPTLVAKAQQLGANPMTSKLLAASLGSTAEGATLGGLPAVLEDRAPTQDEFKQGVLFALGARGAAKGLSAAGSGVRKFVNEPTSMQIQEAKERAAEIKSAESKVKRAEGRLMGIERERAAIKREEKEAREYISEISNENSRKGLMPAKDIEKELYPLVQKGDAALNSSELELKQGLNARLQEHIDKAENAITDLAKRYGWKPERRVPRSEGRSRYLYFTKNGVRKEIRISAHDTDKTNLGFYNLRNSDRKNLIEIERYLNRGGKPTLKEISKTADWYAGELAKADTELETVISGKTTKEIKPEQITPTTKEIDAYMKSHASNPNITREKAAVAITQAKKSILLRGAKEELLPLRERFLRASKNIASKVIRQFNVSRPLEESIIKAEKATGSKIKHVDNPVTTVEKLNTGGEQEELLQPLTDTVYGVEKKYPGSLEGARAYLDAAKRIQFAKAAGRVPEKQLTDIVNLYKDDAPVQQIVEKVRDLNARSLDRIYESGRLDTQKYNELKKNDAYVPSWLEKYDEAGEQIVANNKERYLKEYTGSGELYQNPVITSMQQAKQIDSFAELQKAKKQYIAIAKNTGDAVKIPSKTEYKGGEVKFNKKNQIVVWEEGQPQVWNVPEDVATFFNPKPFREEGPVLKTLKTFQNMFKGGTTAASLGFSYSNIFRDVQPAAMASKYGAYVDVPMMRESAHELMTGAPITKALFKEYGGKTLLKQEQITMLNKDSVKDVENLMKASSSAFKEGTPQNILANAFNTALPKYAKKAANMATKSGKKALEAMTYAGNLGEETTRLSVFKSVLKGRAKNEAQYQLWIKNPNSIPKDVLAEAGYEAREVTLNFTRKMAPWVEFSNKYLLPYFKPSILGAMRGFEALTNPEISQRAWRAIINLGVLQGLINSKLGSKEELEKYEAVNNDMAAKNFVITGKYGRVYLLPLSQEFGPLSKLFGLATESIARYAKGNKQRSDMWREAGAASLEELQNLVPAAGYIATPSNWVFTQPLKVGVEEAMGKDLYSGTPIEPEYLKQLPRSLRYSASTSRTMIELAKLASKFGVEISPLRMQHIVKGSLSSTGKEWLSLSDYALSTLVGADLRPKQDIENNPLIRRFVANIYAPYSQTSLDARKIIEENQEGYNAIKKGLVTQGDANYNRYLKQANKYASIKGAADELNKVYSNRKKVLQALQEDGVKNRLEYQQGKITKDELLRKNDKAISKHQATLEMLKEQQRMLENIIIEDSRK